MAKISIEIEDKNIDVVLMILNSIKKELILDIKCDNQNITSKKTPYKYTPKNGIKKRVATFEENISGTTSLKNDFPK